MKVNEKVKNLQGAYSRYLRTPNTRNALREVYKTYSAEKERAFAYCLEKLTEYRGYNLKIVGANTSEFSVGFIGYYEGEQAFFYITKAYDKVCLLSDLEG